MDLNQIAVFIRVVESGSMTRAAQLLKQPKSRVSRRIAALERELGTTLLYRSTRQFSVTEAGQTLYQRCRKQVYDLENAAEALHKESGAVTGVLRLTAAEDFGSNLLGPVLAELGRRHPQLAVDLHLSNQVVDLVKTGVDLAVRIGELEDASLKTRLIGRVGFILVASPRYLAKAPRITRVEQLSEHPALFFDTGDEEQDWRLRSKGQREESVVPRIRFRSNHPKILHDLAISGQGVALLPEFFCKAAIASGKLKRILSHHETKTVPVSFVWPPQKELSAKVRAFVEIGMEILSPSLKAV